MIQFDFINDYVLENEQVLLRPLVAQDYDQLLEYSMNEPELWRFNAWGAAGAENLRIYIDNAIDKRQKALEYPFIVFDKVSGKYVGSTRFLDFQFERKGVQVGHTWYGKAVQGTALNKNCKHLLFDFAFAQLGMERVGLAANTKNERSINAMKSIGCTIEGVLRNFSFGADGERIDVVVLSVLRNEWYGGLKKQLEDKINLKLEQQCL